MALGDNTKQAARGNGERGRKPYMVETTLDFATALSDKGSALAANDVIPVFEIKAGTLVLNAGAQIVEAANSTTLTLDIGTGVDADVFVDGFDGKSAADTYAQNPAVYQPVMAVADDAIDVKAATLTGTLSTGKVRVWAICMDCTAMGDGAADEVARDALA
jgi:hypothetical protein